MRFRTANGTLVCADDHDRGTRFRVIVVRVRNDLHINREEEQEEEEEEVEEEKEIEEEKEGEKE